MSINKKIEVSISQERGHFEIMAFERGEEVSACLWAANWQDAKVKAHRLAKDLGAYRVYQYVAGEKIEVPAD